MLQQPPILSRQTSQQLHHSLIPHILRSDGNTRNTPLYGNAPLSLQPVHLSLGLPFPAMAAQPPPSQSPSLPGPLVHVGPQETLPAASERHIIKLHNSATNSAASFSPREPARSNCARRGSTSIAGGGAPTPVVHQHVFANSEMGGAPCSEICFRMNCQKKHCE
ncbi:predicted protein [Thalassiosira pseudonana CCMP1335]|uniref:Uncharacterized protein n=1 Tax=Thalassiosira pseudonana TaxID=35128 RepID=B8CCX2_THAPS|nr:predicted protein [Thalassiosira pseudonana CCMP1335]EED89023.1 predicted protein [Thalassiosira pseudonana CCMP1335]